MIIILFLLLFAGSIQPGVIQLFNSSCKEEFVQAKTTEDLHLDFNETETSQPLVIYNTANETTSSGNQSSVVKVDKNQFAETVVDLILVLLQKANLSSNV